MLTISRRFEFDMGHRVYEHEGKCRFPHGHRYMLIVSMTSDELNQLGMVCDFGQIKDIVGDWIDKRLDHGFMVYEKDAELLEAFGALSSARIIKVEFNPTAENIASFLHTHLQRVMPDGITITQIELFETPNCKAISTW